MKSLENAVPLSEAAKRWLPPARTGRPIHPSVLARWSESGIEINGRRVRLVTTRIGGQRYVTQADLQKFLEELNATPLDAGSLAADESPGPDQPKPSRVKQMKNAALVALS